MDFYQQLDGKTSKGQEGAPATAAIGSGSGLTAQVYLG